MGRYKLSDGSLERVKNAIKRNNCKGDRDDDDNPDDNDDDDDDDDDDDNSISLLCHHNKKKRNVSFVTCFDGLLYSHAFPIFVPIHL
jgi:hypothetical protein